MRGVLLGVAFVLAGCSSTPPAAEDPSAAAAGGDRGNGVVTTSLAEGFLSDRVVVALYADPEVDDEQLGQSLVLTAQKLGVSARLVSANVLDLASLEGEFPDVVAALEPGASEETAAEIADLLPEQDGVYHRFAAEVLVHDLRLRVTPETAAPEDVLASVAREGILADSLGDYAASVSNGQIVVTYVGPVLSDEQVTVVREALAEGSGVSVGQVAVSAGSPGLSTGPASPAPPPPVEDAGGHG